MQTEFYKFLLWHTRRALSRLGFAGVAGLGLLVFAALFYIFSSLPISKEVQALKQEASAKQVRSQTDVEQTALQPGAQLEKFYQSFPGAKTVPDTLQKVYRIAAAQEIELDEGDYNLVRNDDDKIARYEMSFPVKGDYMHLRKFLARLLVDIPNASLDSVDFQRQKIGDTMVDAQIKITLYLLGE